MKFLCDRCKTRYSIGDDRVRGKILKIRCKNCANVITVREGMTADDIGEPNRARSTTNAPMSTAPAPPAGALASAFATQSAKPPPALEEEWYVSIDGDQSGPFNLADAQRWIAAKPFDADVHCWSEGFDDWLPVDKVSHFRGLRKRPRPPTAPPPLPRVAPGRTGPAAALQQVEEEPKPLFAATMASLEKAAGIPASPVTPPHGILAKANGTGSTKSPTIQPISAPATTTKNGSGPNRNMQTAGAKALAAAFDASESANASSTVDAPPLANVPKKTPLPAPVVEDHDEPDESDGAPPEDDSLDIGEVSRVVKLADIAKMGNSPRKVSRAPIAAAAGRTSGAAISLRNATSSTPKLDPAALGLGAEPGVVLPPMDPAPPVVAQSHRRGLIMLIGVAAVLLIGVAVLVVVMLQHDDTDSNGGLVQTHTIDTERPEQLVFRQLPGEGSGSAVAQKPIPQIHHPVHPNGSGSSTPQEDPGEGKGDKLKSDEIEDMARKQAAGTQRCYMRAQRGAEGIEIADLKKLSVTLTVDKTGAVTDVTLDKFQTASLGQCIVGQIKHWKFRESPGGLYRIILAFAS